MTSSCTGIGLSKPNSVIARRISSLTPNSSNVFNEIKYKLRNFRVQRYNKKLRIKAE